jgi:4-hydroxyphenylpyruvate dioxygenase
MTRFDHYVLWAGNVRALPYAERLACARAGGFNAMSIAPLDFVRFTADGLSAADLRHMAADAGVKLLTLDPIANWTEHWSADGIPEAARPFVAFTQDDFFDIADQLQVESITAMSTAAPGSLPRQQIVDGFADLTDRGARHGLRVGLEFMPMWSVADLQTAWDIVLAVDHPNAGIVFDVWHFMRSRPDFTFLSTLPGAKIFHAQFADASATLPEGRSLNEDCLFHRLELGTGGFPLERITRTLKDIEGLQSVGSEVFSSTFDTLTAADIALRSGPPLRQLLHVCGVEPPTG